MNKIIFLDFDGVLNYRDRFGELVPSCVKTLSKLLIETGAKVVISSSWRMGSWFSVSEFKERDATYNCIDEIGATEFFKKAMIKEGIIFKIDSNDINLFIDRIIGLTPYEDKCSTICTRHKEIMQWMKKHNYNEKFVIIDDNEVVSSEEMFMTNSNIGLTNLDVDRIIKFLK
ncbi:MAG TPA: HAD domain-containing protein [Candidatus Glassbacteria bacterium]|nr:HAD domain-containing protein [Candidatus Glassbacteria bacterium]